MAGANGRAMKRVALSKVKDDLSRYLRLAESEEVIITRHGQPAGVLIGCAAQGGLVRLPAGGDRSRVRWSPEGARIELKAGPGGFSFEDLVKHCVAPQTCAD